MSLCLLTEPIHPAGIERLEAAGIAVRLATRPEAEIVAAEIAEADAVITRGFGLAAQAMDRAPRLKVIGSHGVGTDAIDVAHATRLGIAVVNSPEANRQAVAEHVFALMLALAKRLAAADAAARRGDFAFKHHASIGDLAGKVLGVVGFGGIGRRVAAIGRAGFAMKVLVLSDSAGEGEIEAAGFRRAASLHALLAEADIVSLHRTLRPATRGMIGQGELRAMRPGAILLNTARGDLLDEAALADALRQGRLAGAGLDVFAQEGMRKDCPLLRAPNCILTPHIAGSSQAALRGTAEEIAGRIVAVLAGEAAQLDGPRASPRSDR
ncbi:NAD(P)-dependent oxidoreductase [Afifella pfennigii]|uniref:NAD(P)-dependent oxidoreductase n=1 Tax=Afifella pfennigii TaxID=209897 RepID=UPI00068FEB18|nr:NAD(P)-dependent oxidoreductase [Afifella pfennigii]